MICAQKGLVQTHEDVGGFGPNTFSFVQMCVGTIHQVRRDEMDYPEAQCQSCRMTPIQFGDLFRPTWSQHEGPFMNTMNITYWGLVTHECLHPLTIRSLAM